MLNQNLLFCVDVVIDNFAVSVVLIVRSPLEWCLFLQGYNACKKWIRSHKGFLLVFFSHNKS